jgi:hypothetical protein
MSENPKPLINPALKLCFDVVREYLDCDDSARQYLDYDLADRALHAIFMEFEEPPTQEDY